MTEQFYLMPPDTYALYMQYRDICEKISHTPLQDTSVIDEANSPAPLDMDSVDVSTEDPANETNTAVVNTLSVDKSIHVPTSRDNNRKSTVHWLNDDDIDLLVQLFPRLQGKKVREILMILKRANVVALSKLKRVLYDTEGGTSEGSHLYELLRYITTVDRKTQNNEEAPLDLTDFIKLLKRAKVPTNLYSLPASLKWIGLKK